MFVGNVERYDTEICSVLSVILCERFSGMTDNCIVGRGLVNDALEGWSEPCEEPVTEEFIVPVGKWFPESVDTDVWPFCSEHGKQFQQALHDATEGACN